MSQGSQLTASRVLLLEFDPSLRRLMALGLRHHDHHVVEATSLASVLATDLQAIDLLVIDVDHGFTCDWSLLESVRKYPQLAHLPIVVLSWEPQAEQEHASGGGVATLTSRVTWLRKPFDARALHEEIDALLALRTAEKVEQYEQAEAVLLATYDKRTAPSIWPVITAAGLLLAVIGLLVQFALVIVGVLIVVASLLLWTLGSQAHSKATPKVALSVSHQ